MVAELIVAYFHFAGILLTAGTLVTELVLYRRDVTAQSAARLQRVDQWFGIAAGTVLLTGILRVFWVGKGMDYYLSNPVFHLKWVLFVTIGLISIAPTVHFIRWGQGPREGRAPVIPDARFKLMRRLILVEVHLLAILPLLAVLMARGVGR